MSDKYKDNIERAINSFRIKIPKDENANSLEIVDGIKSDLISNLTNKKNILFEGYVSQEDFDAKNKEMEALKSDLAKKDESIKGFQEKISQNKLALLKGKVTSQTEQLVIDKFGEEMKEDGSNLEDIIKKANEEMPFTKMEAIPNFKENKENSFKSEETLTKEQFEAIKERMSK